MLERLSGELAAIADNCLKTRELLPELSRVIDRCVDSLKHDGAIFFCGNGGSASQAQHLSAELVGRYKLDRLPMRSAALTVDTSVLTAVGNDYGFEEVFSRQIRGLGRPGDVLFGLSTSGNSENVVRAFEAARSKKITTVAMIGTRLGRLRGMADYLLAVPASEANSVQELHLIIGHMICDGIERTLCGGGQ
ncbi:MAG: SIS domain-containing protein [Thermoguttaceae bacterium]|nr:SIS domain-containing protein [Thermoguttaceae bacterium]